MDITQIAMIIVLVIGVLWVFSRSFKRTVRRWNNRFEEFYSLAPFKFTAMLLAIFIYVVGADSVEKSVILGAISASLLTKSVIDLVDFFKIEFEKSNKVEEAKRIEEEKIQSQKELLDFYSGKNVEIDDIRGF
jgi:Kef-type K+ transport system membrane component KefB